MTEIDIWKFLAGIGLFLFGMHSVESSIKELAGKSFKKFLKKYTTNRFLAILNGIVATALLQSSSIILIMVIAFAGAGILTLTNSLGLILGANLGTTFTGWIVAYLGFELSTDNLVFPLMSIGGIGLALIGPRFKFHQGFILILGFSFLLLGLTQMKSGMSHLTESIDIKQVEMFGLIGLFFVGFFVTALIQSSSAMMTLTLGALHAGLFPLSSAVYVVLGADLGTTITALLASFKGTPVKKRVGLAHFFFNLITALLGLIFAQQLLEFVIQYLKIENPLYALVAFHSSFNTLGILLFFPFLGQFEKFLNSLFVNDRERVCQFIHKVSVDIPEASLLALHKEAGYFLNKVHLFNSSLLGFQFDKKTPNTLSPILEKLWQSSTVDENYKSIKRMESEVLEYANFIQMERLEKHEIEKLNQSVTSFRNGVQSAKYLKDIEHNLEEYRQSVLDIDERFLNEILIHYRKIHFNFEHILNDLENSKAMDSMLEVTFKENEAAFEAINNWIYKTIKELGEFETKMPSFLNVNREVYNSNLLFIECSKNVIHDHEEQ
ncbi:MAG: Na/Pi cotransporter family protein [Bdellovibrionales bacterium]